MNDIAKEIAHHLLQIKAIKLSPQKPFTWASGIQSPIYCDNRVITSYPPIRRIVINCFKDKSKAFEPFDAIAGVATGGIAHGVLLAERLDLPFIYVRSKAKEHGRQNLVEGELPEGTKVLVIEDLISTGGSSLSAVEALRSSGLEVVGLIAIFTYGFEQSVEAFRQAHCKMDTLTDYPTLLEEAVETYYIQPEALQTLQEWRRNPHGWQAEGMGE